MFNNNVEPLENLIDQFAQFPGIGRKSAVRMAYQVMSMPPKQAMELAKAIEHAKSDLHRCRICQDYTTGDVCKICASQKRDRSIICVVEGPRDIKSIERTHEYNGLYHVLHGLISPMDGIGADQLCIKELLARLNDTVKEVIMATSPTVEGEATAMYIAKLIKPLGIKPTAWPMACPSARVWNTSMRRRCTVPWPDAARCKKVPVPLLPVQVFYCSFISADRNPADSAAHPSGYRQSRHPLPHGTCRRPSAGCAASLPPLRRGGCPAAHRRAGPS